MKEYPEIIKQDGTREAFDPDKLRDSLHRAGAHPEVCSKITDQVAEQVKAGDTTSAIYRKAFSLLKRRKEQIPAARYSMKRAIRELGPSGFPFEKFVAEIWKARGFTAKTGVMLAGVCAEHEVDMVAEKDGMKIGAEVKFHNNLGITSDLKVALYVDARFVDLRERIDEGWLITNTRFTENALAYGACRNMKMVSWSYPRRGSLQDLIEEAGVQPITALTTLTKQEKTDLLEEGVALCKFLTEQPQVLERIVPDNKLERVVSEGVALCSSAKKA